MNGYDVAQECLNGHMVNRSARRFLAHNAAYCSKCGARTIFECENCHALIRGYDHVSGVIGFSGPDHPEAYCHACGTAYPWTLAALSAAKELTAELDELSDDERAQLAEVFSDLVVVAANDGRPRPVPATRRQSGSGAVEGFGRSSLMS
jgi:hypothetical protein